MENGNTFPSGVGGDTLPQDFPAGMRVLVVEDDPNCLEDLTQILESCGYKVTAKASPREALKEVEENGEGFHFDIIMTVVHGGEGVAGFDGFDLLERIRDRYPVIIFSTDYSKKMVMRTINEGACCFLTKPLCYQEMRNIWFHVLQWRDERGLEVDGPEKGLQGTRQWACRLGIGIGLHGRGLGVAVPGVCVGVGWLLASIVLAVHMLLAAGQKYV